MAPNWALPIRRRRVHCIMNLVLRNEVGKTVLSFSFHPIPPCILIGQFITLFHHHPISFILYTATTVAYLLSHTVASSFSYSFHQTKISPISGMPDRGRECTKRAAWLGLWTEFNLSIMPHNRSRSSSYHHSRHSGTYSEDLVVSVTRGSHSHYHSRHGTHSSQYYTLFSF